MTPHHDADAVLAALVAGQISAADAVAELVRLGASQAQAEYQVASMATVDIPLAKEP